MEGYMRGKVSSIDTEKGFVKVTYPKHNDYVSDWLPLLSSEYNMPCVGDYVATIVDSEGEGVCLGKIYTYSQPPPRKDGKYEKDIGNIKIVYDGSTFKVDFGNGDYMTYNDGKIRMRAESIKFIEHLPPEDNER